MSGDTIVIAHHPYEPQREDELQLAKGDRVFVTDSSDPDWWVGKKEDGTSGYFPSNFVEPAQSEEKTAVVEETNQEHEPEAAPPKPIGMARVMEDYAMQGPDELTLHRGGIVTLYERFDDGWLKGEINGKVGRFPAEFVEDIDMPGRPDLGLQSVEASKNKEDVAENAEPSKPAFKLAAYGVKQGGIGSVLAGGFPVLKKTGGIKKIEEEQPKPANELSQAAEKQPEAAPTMPSEKQPKAETEPTKYIAKAIVLHPYDAENEDELNLLRGEYVNVIDKNVDEGWWKGTTERGQTGVFPSNFVKEVEEETIASPPPVRSRKSIASTGSQQSFSSTSASRVSTGISQRAPPLPDKSSRPTSMATSSRPGSVHDQTISPSNEIPPPVPEILQAPRTTSEVGERPPPLPETRPPPVPEPSTRPKSLHEKEPAEEVPSAVSNETTTKEAVATKEESVQFPQEPLDNESTATAVAAEQKHDEAENDVPLSPANSPPAIPGRPSIPSSRPSSESGNLASPPPPVLGRPPVTPSRKSSESADVASPPAVPGRPPSIPSRRSSESVDLASPSPATAAPSTEPIAEATETEQSSESKPVQEQAAEKKEEEEEEEEKAAIEESESQQVKEQEKETKGEQALEKDEIIAVGPEENLAKPEESSESTATKEVSEEAETEPKRQELEMQPSGPRLSAPSRARPARARRSPETRKEEPSQMEMLQQQLDQTPPEEPKKEEPKEEPTPPAKPIKPIFTKFPTPFAGGTPPELKNLKPVQRRMWEPAPAHEQETKKEEAEEPPRPTGVRNIASRFNMPSSGGSNEVLETKLKNFTKNEVEKSRKELERQLQEEREKRIQLEELVASLAEKVEQLQSRLEQ